MTRRNSDEESSDDRLYRSLMLQPPGPEPEYPDWRRCAMILIGFLLIALFVGGVGAILVNWRTGAAVAALFVGAGLIVGGIGAFRPRL